MKAIGGVDVIVLNHATLYAIGYWEGSRENITKLQNVMESTFTSHVILASDAMPYLQKSNGSIAVVSSLFGTLSELTSRMLNRVI